MAPSFLISLPMVLQIGNHRSSATVVYVCNLTNKRGQTDGFGLADYVAAINAHFRRSRIDYVIAPTRRPHQGLVAKYERKEGKASVVDFGQIKENEDRDIALFGREYSKVLAWRASASHRVHRLSVMTATALPRRSWKYWSWKKAR